MARSTSQKVNSGSPQHGQASVWRLYTMVDKLHYSVFRTMPSDLESMCTKACVCWPMLELLDQSLGIVLLSLQVVEESKEFVSGAITAKLTLQRFCLFEGFLFHRQSGFQVDLSRFDRFVPKPQCDDRAIHAALQ